MNKKYNFNIKYEQLFDIVKNEYIKKNKVFLSNFNVYYKHKSKEDVELMNYCNATGLEEFQKIDDKNGLCMPLSLYLLEIAAIISKCQYSFLTFGRITTTIDNHDIFNVGNKEFFLERYSNTETCSNIHAWITLSDGTIIDPSIESRKNLSTLVIGSPEQLSAKYEYSPYLIVSCIETTPLSNFDLEYCYDRIKKIKSNYKS